MLSHACVCGGREAEAERGLQGVGGEEACGFVHVAVSVCTDAMMLGSNHRLLNVRARPSSPSGPYDPGGQGRPLHVEAPAARESGRGQRLEVYVQSRPKLQNPHAHPAQCVLSVSPSGGSVPGPFVRITRL
jgi:hypothetical protein